MGTYRQYCPVARASEILAERWNPLIVRNLMFGADTFSAIARGVPTMSRSMLLKRLDELEHAGVIRSEAKTDGHGHTYHLTDAGADLAGIIGGMAEWGERWLEMTTEHSDPAFALWAWVQVQLDRSALPTDRRIVAMIFPDERPTNRRYWLLIDGGDAELCYRDPGGQPDLVVEARSRAFVDWHRGARSWADAIRSGDIKLTGPAWLRRSFPTWNAHRPISAR
ncbi:helix-turn-helix domain-containing protein [Mycobacterium sp. 3519A]|uniref:winged helix-turn-helix transcriptional regulator n=1 Tax=Mycobacterium sp. 3519A TaxID=2057184 RepID=UPI000C7AD24E|nr:winged helix-turn-helix transcriptional regulator [Mycobacterium sp. 3519A]